MRYSILLTILIFTNLGCGDSKTPFDNKFGNKKTSASEAKYTEPEKIPDKPVEVTPEKDTEANTEEDAGTPAPLLASPLPPGKPMLLDFTKDHCMPCQIMAPWVKSLREKYKDTVGVMELNTDRKENKPLGMFFKVHSIPTQVYIDKKGDEVKRHVGLATEEQMEKMLKGLGFVE